MKLEEEINQAVFKNEYQKVQINVLVTSAWINQNTNKALKKFNISWQQFNILRILRGRHPEPASVKLLAERMIDKMSNASRLVEKLKLKNLVERKACPEDRRKVDILITEEGLALIEEASAIIEQQGKDLEKNLSKEEATLLSNLLDKMRD